MSARIAVARAVFDAAYFSGLSRLLRPVAQGRGVILCLHHVLPATPGDGFAPNSNLETTPEFLDQMLLHLKSRGYRFLSLDDVVRELQSGETPEKPFAVFTLDDGYRDNLVHGAPVFRRHACPYAVYVCSGLVNGTTEMWWRALEDIIRRSAGRSFTVAGQRFQVGDAGAASFNAAWDFLFPRLQALPEKGQRVWIRDAAKGCGLDLAQQCRASLMTWDEVREMGRDPLATIGAHTVNHFVTSKLSADEALRELADSKAELERELGRLVPHFAFPYGNVAHAGPRDFAIAARAGFATAVTTRLGSVHAAHASHLHALPRIIVSSRFARRRWVEVLASGTAGYIFNRGRTLNIG
ncbi:MAG: polysaccharide deacetylase family protein [Hyphomicrobiales bacterium]